MFKALQMYRMCHPTQLKTGVSIIIEGLIYKKPWYKMSYKNTSTPIFDNVILTVHTDGQGQQCSKRGGSCPPLPPLPLQMIPITPTPPLLLSIPQTVT